MKRKVGILLLTVVSLFHLLVFPLFYIEKQELETQMRIELQENQTETEQRLEEIEGRIDVLNTTHQKEIKRYEMKLNEMKNELNEKIEEEAGKNVKVSQSEQGKEYIITAYTNRPAEGTNGITASGEPTVEGETVACPRTIPLGTDIHIEGIGNRTCEDRGGAIKGNRLDLYIEDLKEALEFGEQKRKVTVING